MNKKTVLLSFMLASALVLFGSSSFAQGTSYWGTAFQGMTAYSQGAAEGFEEGTYQGSIFQERFVGLKPYDPAESGFTQGAMEGAHEPSNWQKVVGDLSPYAPYATE